MSQETRNAYGQELAKLICAREDIVVLELSSFQLMDMEVSPDISVITNITPNHLDKHTDFEEYVGVEDEDLE